MSGEAERGRGGVVSGNRPACQGAAPSAGKKGPRPFWIICWIPGVPRKARFPSGLQDCGKEAGVDSVSGWYPFGFVLIFSVIPILWQSDFIIIIGF